MSDACYITEAVREGVGATITLDGDEGRHAAKVKRTRVGERLILTDGQGTACRGEVVETGPTWVRVRLDEALPAPDQPIRWIMVQALAKGERSEIAVESLTELGASEIWAWQAERSIPRWESKAAKGIARWQATAVASTKQSRRATIPVIDYVTTTELVRRIAKVDLCLVAHEEATCPLSEIDLPASGAVMVIVGPEGGISDDEIRTFTSAGARTISLGTGILRTSSAGVVSLAQLELLRHLQKRNAA